MNVVDLARSASVFLEKVNTRYSSTRRDSAGEIVVAQLRKGIPKLRKVGAPGVSYKNGGKSNHDNMGITSVGYEFTAGSLLSDVRQSNETPFASRY